MKTPCLSEAIKPTSLTLKITFIIVTIIPVIIVTIKTERGGYFVAAWLTMIAISP